MFYSEEDVVPVAGIAVEMFGPNGNILDGKNVTKNVIIGTNAFGKIWYGDVDGSEEFIADMCAVMSARVNMQVMHVNESF